jgi:hypothetical protein
MRAIFIGISICGEYAATGRSPPTGNRREWIIVRFLGLCYRLFLDELLDEERIPLSLPENQALRCLREEDTSHGSRRLQAGRYIGRISHRGIVHAQIVPDAPHYHHSGVKALPQPRSGSSATEGLSW